VTPTPGSNGSAAPTAAPVVPPVEMLRALEPALARGIERHQAVATEWFPHDYVPYEVGRNYVDEPWEEKDSDLTPIARISLEVNLLTEDNLPYYHLALWNTFGQEGAWGEWVRLWTAEEGRHAIVLRDYLTVTRGLDPVALERGRMDQVKRGYYPGWDGYPDPLGGVVYTTLQELATRIAHRNTGVITEDPLIRKLTARIATDENLHHVFYRDVLAAALKLEPSAAVRAIVDEVLAFKMPGAGIPGFLRKAAQIAKAGIYDLKVHRDEVLLPILRHWRIFELPNLDAAAEDARRRLSEYLAKLDESIAHFEERLALSTIPRIATSK
jgi:acyl-[acyl-carrier-protein] desaturase